MNHLSLSGLCIEREQHPFQSRNARRDVFVFLEPRVIVLLYSGVSGVSSAKRGLACASLLCRPVGGGWRAARCQHRLPVTVPLLLYPTIASTCLVGYLDFTITIFLLRRVRNAFTLSKTACHPLLSISKTRSCFRCLHRVSRHPPRGDFISF